MALKLDIKIRPIKRTDISSVKKMMDELNLYHGETKKSSCQQIMDGCFLSKLTRCLVVEHKSKLIGFSFGYDLMNYVRGKRIHFIDYFFIKEKYRSMGCGQALLHRIIQSAQTRGCGLVYVTTSHLNKHADQFYKDYGFEKQSKAQSNKFILKI